MDIPFGPAITYLDSEETLIPFAFQCVLADVSGFALVIVKHAFGVKMLNKVLQKGLVRRIKLTITNFKVTAEAFMTNDKSTLALDDKVGFSQTITFSLHKYKLPFTFFASMSSGNLHTISSLGSP